MIELVPVDARALAQATGYDVDRPVFGLAGVEDGEVLGIGGLAWGGGRCWLFFTMMKQEPRFAFYVRRAAMRLLRTARQLGETDVFTPRDAQHATSERLLRSLGFEPSGQEQGVEIWHVRT